MLPRGCKVVKNDPEQAPGAIPKVSTKATHSRSRPKLIPPILVVIFHPDLTAFAREVVLEVTTVSLGSCPLNRFVPTVCHLRRAVARIQQQFTVVLAIVVEANVELVGFLKAHRHTGSYAGACHESGRVLGEGSR